LEWKNDGVMDDNSGEDDTCDYCDLGEDM